MTKKRVKNRIATGRTERCLNFVEMANCSNNSSSSTSRMHQQRQSLASPNKVCCWGAHPCHLTLDNVNSVKIRKRRSFLAEGVKIQFWKSLLCDWKRLQQIISSSLWIVGFGGKLPFRNNSEKCIAKIAVARNSHKKEVWIGKIIQKSVQKLKIAQEGD